MGQFSLENKNKEKEEIVNKPHFKNSNHNEKIDSHDADNQEKKPKKNISNKNTPNNTFKDNPKDIEQKESIESNIQVEQCFVASNNSYKQKDYYNKQQDIDYNQDYSYGYNKDYHYNKNYYYNNKDYHDSYSYQKPKYTTNKILSIDNVEEFGDMVSQASVDPPKTSSYQSYQKKPYHNQFSSQFNYNKFDNRYGGYQDYKNSSYGGGGGYKYNDGYGRDEYDQGNGENYVKNNKNEYSNLEVKKSKNEQEKQPMMSIDPKKKLSEFL